jgi:hypothetical protein
VPILIFPDWENTFHVHVDASNIALGAILAQPEARDFFRDLTPHVGRIIYSDVIKININKA